MAKTGYEFLNQNTDEDRSLAAQLGDAAEARRNNILNDPTVAQQLADEAQARQNAEYQQKRAAEIDRLAKADAERFMVASGIRRNLPQEAPAQTEEEIAEEQARRQRLRDAKADSFLNSIHNSPAVRRQAESAANQMLNNDGRPDDESLLDKLLPKPLKGLFRRNR